MKINEMSVKLREMMETDHQKYVQKAMEYGMGDDAFYNFYEGSMMNDIGEAKYLFHLLTKQLICVRDICNDKYTIPAIINIYQEKIRDCRIYLYILEAILDEQLEQ